MLRKKMEVNTNIILLQHHYHIKCRSKEKSH